MIETKVLSLSDFDINFNSNFAIIGNGESGNNYKYNQDKISIMAVNRSIRFLDYLNEINCVTMYLHVEQMIEYIKSIHIDLKNCRKINLIVVYLCDISKYRLPSGDTLNMLVHYIIHGMRDNLIRDKKIYLSGVDFSYKKNWKQQIESLNYSNIISEYDNNKIINTSNNERIDFIEFSKPENILLI